jgi:hypothetical protein
VRSLYPALLLAASCGGTAPPPASPPPPPPPAGAIEPADDATAERLRGDTQIVPDDTTKNRLVAARVRAAAGTFRVCFDATGAIIQAVPVASTGVPAYDQRITNAIHTWQYAPHSVDGKPTPACTRVTIVYRLR